MNERADFLCFRPFRVFHGYKEVYETRNTQKYTTGDKLRSPHLFVCEKIAVSIVRIL
jgi:hypothetical protein